MKNLTVRAWRRNGTLLPILSVMKEQESSEIICDSDVIIVDNLADQNHRQILETPMIKFVIEGKPFVFSSFKELKKQLEK